MLTLVSWMLKLVILSKFASKTAQKLSGPNGPDNYRTAPTCVCRVYSLAPHSTVAPRGNGQWCQLRQLVRTFLSASTSPSLRDRRRIPAFVDRTALSGARTLVVRARSPGLRSRLRSLAPQHLPKPPTFLSGAVQLRLFRFLLHFEGELRHRSSRSEWCACAIVVCACAPGLWCTFGPPPKPQK